MMTFTKEADFEKALIVILSEKRLGEAGFKISERNRFAQQHAQGDGGFFRSTKVRIQP